MARRCRNITTQSRGFPGCVGTQSTGRHHWRRRGKGREPSQRLSRSQQHFGRQGGGAAEVRIRVRGASPGTPVDEDPEGRSHREGSPEVRAWALSCSKLRIQGKALANEETITVLGEGPPRVRGSGGAPSSGIPQKPAGGLEGAPRIILPTPRGGRWWGEGKGDVSKHFHWHVFMFEFITPNSHTPGCLIHKKRICFSCTNPGDPFQNSSDIIHVRTEQQKKSLSLWSLPLR